MAYEITVGLCVTDPESYARYRAEITPLLEEAGAGFRYDLEVARNLKTDTFHDINRLFVLRFPDRASKERFFADDRYVEIRRRLFAPAVHGSTTLAEYDI